MSNDANERIPFIPIWLDGLPLTPTQFRVLAHLWSRAGKKKKCWPSAPVIIKACQISENTLWKVLRDLEAMDLLSRSKRKQNSNMFSLNVQREVTANETVTEASAVTANEGVTQSPESNAFDSTLHSGVTANETVTPPSSVTAKQTVTTSDNDSHLNIDGDSTPKLDGDSHRNPDGRNVRKECITMKCIINTGATPPRVCGVDDGLAEKLQAANPSVYPSTIQTAVVHVRKQLTAGKQIGDVLAYAGAIARESAEHDPLFPEDIPVIEAMKRQAALASQPSGTPDHSITAPADLGDDEDPFC